MGYRRYRRKYSNRSYDDAELSSWSCLLAVLLVVVFMVSLSWPPILFFTLPICLLLLTLLLYSLEDDPR